VLFITKREFSALAAFAAIVVLSSCSVSSSTNAATKDSKERKAAPEFTLTDANGSPVKLSDYRGKVVLLNFWATWCGPCALEIPWFIEFQQDYKSRGFEVLGISMDDDGWAAIKPYVAEHKMNYRVLLGNDSVSQLYGGVDALPTSFVIDREGRIASVHVGLAGKNDYVNEIQSLLGEKQTGTARGGLRAVPAALFTGAAK
jgi:peroxiredoxin